MPVLFNLYSATPHGKLTEEVPFLNGNILDGKMESRRTLEGVWGPVWEAERSVVFGVNKA